MKLKLWLLLGLLTVLLAIGTALVLMFVQAQNPSYAAMPAFPAIGGTQSAQQAYTALQQWAKGWAADVQLVSISASLVKSERASLGWSFQVYSKSKGKLAVVLVEPERVWVLREKSIRYQQRSIDAQAWPIDSPQFLARWWEQRGEMIWQQRRAQSMHLNLRYEKGGSTVWQISVLDAQGNLIEYWGIRADTGEVLYEGIAGGTQ